MSFPRYPKYKDSGVEWLGEVPEHWEVVRIRNLFEIKKRIAGELGFDVFSVTQNGIRVKDTESNEGQLSMDYSKYQLVEPSDFAMNPMDLLTGGADIAFTRGVTSPDYRVFSIRDAATTHDRFFLYLFTMMYRQQIFFHLGRGSSQLGRWRLPRDEFNNFRFPLPPLPEQRAIATFLDGETAKIDALVAEQQRLIELLQEKRQAVISHAVTKGLNPHAPMKDSGIEWLGMVPEHWEVVPLKRLGTIQYGIGEPPTYHEDGIPLIRATNVRSGKLTTFGLVFVNHNEIPEQRIVWLQTGDIIVVRSGAGTGDSAIIPHDFGPAIAGFDMVFRPQPANAQFIQFCLLSSYVKHAQIDLHKMRAAQPHLNKEELGNCQILLPPIHEQQTIVDFLAYQISTFDSLINAAQRAIDLLQERRTALISAAVTGKIDVRHLASERVA